MENPSVAIVQAANNSIRKQNGSDP